MKLGKKLILGALGLALLITALVQGYVHLHYRMYRDYRSLLSEQTENLAIGTAFKALADSGSGVEGMVLAAENETLKLYTDPATAAVAVLDKRNGRIVRSNPADADNDPLANGQNKAILKSQLVVEFYNANRLAGIYNSSQYAADKEGQLALESIEGGIRYTYTLGDVTLKTGIVPIYITQERLDLFTSKLDEAGVKYVNARYRESASVSGFLELNETAQTGAGQIRRLTTLFEEAGYTKEDFEADMTDSGVEGAVPISFVVPLEYRLDGDSLEVTIPAKFVEENGGGRLYRIQMLRFFGAAGTEEEGYILVPNGSGSLIRFNNGKSHADEYSQYIYGADPLVSFGVVLGNTVDAKMPLFGLHREGQSVLAQITGGDALAVVNAGVAGRINSYNYAYPSFYVRGTATLSMFGATGQEADLPIVEKDMSTSDLTVRYAFMDDDHQGYAGMANYLREILEDNGTLTETLGSGDIPLYLDALGAARGTKFFLGVRYEGIVPMTTYEQAAKVAEDLAAAGVGNIAMNFQGWFNRGYYHDVLDKFQLVSSLGGKKELESLSAALEQNGGTLFLDAALQKVSFSSKHFNYEQETSRYNFGGYAAEGLVSPVTLYKAASLSYRDVLQDLLSPKFLPRYTDNLVKGMNRFDVGGVSLRDLGNTLHSDRKRTEVIDRQQALDIVKAQLGKLEAENGALMTREANLYAALYSDDVVGVPLGHNDFYIVDEEVPFYQMLLHGYVNYGGSAVNFNDGGDKNALALRLIEYGASPSFTFSYEETSLMKYTSLFHQYSTTYDNWREDMTDLYAAVNGALSGVRGARMVGHEVLDSGLRMVSYDNGTVIYVNHTEEALDAGGVTVEAGSWLVKGGNGA